jgi:hypothetical protein
VTQLVATFGGKLQQEEAKKSRSEEVVAGCYLTYITEEQYLVASLNGRFLSLFNYYYSLPGRSCSHESFLWIVIMLSSYLNWLLLVESYLLLLLLLLSTSQCFQVACNGIVKHLKRMCHSNPVYK